MTTSDENTYSVGAIARLTGLSPDVLRAWERRYSVITPLRSEGGTRRYRASDLARLRLVKAAVDAGHRIGEVAQLDEAELEARVAPARDPHRAPLDEVMDALERLDGGEAERLIAAQLSALGPIRFAQDFALPLVRAIGEGWESARLCVASEHLGSALLRSLLGSLLRPTRVHGTAPVVVFGTSSGERHEIGLLIAALSALGAGANSLYLGTDLPVEELLRAVELTDASALALGFTVSDPKNAAEVIDELKSSLPESVELWVGGPRAEGLEFDDRVQRLDDLTRLERRVELLRIRAGAR